MTEDVGKDPFDCLLDVLNRLDDVVKSGRTYRATCPSHSDDGRHLMIRPELGGVTVFCLSCNRDEILGALGLSETDVAPTVDIETWLPLPPCPPRRDVGF